MSFNSARRFRPLLGLLVVLLGSCSAADLMGVPASQSWVLIDNMDQLGRITTTYMTIVKGGAISQGAGNYRMDVTGTCSFTLSINGNWNGNLVRLTSTGGGCGAGYILTMDGTANGEYGKADTMSGTYRISYSGVWGGVETGTWKASLSH